MKQWLDKFGWRENPFNFKIYPDVMVGYKDELSELDRAIKANNKFSVILGKTGAGKTNLLKWIVSQTVNDSNVYYMPKPPKNEENFLEYLRDELLQPGFFSSLFNSYSLYNIHHELDDELNEPSYLVIDEGHEASVEVLEWIRTVIDHVDNLSVITAGLPEFRETLSDEVHTLMSRATDIIFLSSLNKDETISLVKKRIERVGGNSLEPFTQGALLEIYDYTGGFPREILRACNSCVVEAAMEDFSIIDRSDVDNLLEGNSVTRESNDEDESGSDEEKCLDDVSLTPKQRDVVEVLEDKGQSTSGEIADVLGTEDYTSRSHAVRSVNNILKRLMENNIVDRERNGRSYVYFVK